MHSIPSNNQAINQSNQDNIKHESIHKQSLHIYRIKKEKGCIGCTWITCITYNALACGWRRLAHK